MATDWLTHCLTAPNPRCLRWLDDVEDRVPVWALPWLLSGLMVCALLPVAAAVWWLR